ncbi:hypothetical protein KIH74_20665 [Kineosporia sp. J2-2]|uniref:Uncharacterized protein n=1 Tax=Kineosporia corallincola TaxID=2835133 RepID=A0ABS5TJS5_9ACTN|nr:hypothetical protein [Kineosporia corallincola]MBT0771363.1 hypothetical protein [Kineosporia corallincola]
MTPTLALALTSTLVTLGYVLACRIWPYANCWKCSGAGRFRSPSGRAWRLCRRCSGSGARLRIGRRLWNLAARELGRTRDPRSPH